MATLTLIETERASLVRKYERLSELEREMLRLYSVIYAPVSKKAFLNCINDYCRATDRTESLNN